MAGPRPSGVPHAFATSACCVAPVRFRSARGHAAVRPRRQRALGDVGCLAAEALPASAAADDAPLRRRLSSEIWRALADPVFARALLNDPVAVLGSTGYTLRQHRR